MRREWTRVSTLTRAGIRTPCGTENSWCAVRAPSTLNPRCYVHKGAWGPSTFTHAKSVCG